MRERIADHDWGITMLLGAAATILSMVGTFVSIKTGLVDIDHRRATTLSDNISQVYERLEAIEDDNDALRNQRYILRAQLLDMEMRLAAEENSVQAICDVIEPMRTPAWVKRYHPDRPEVEDQIIMQCINTAYSRRYGISKEFYEKRSDFEVFHRERALEYYANDMEVINGAGWLQVEETDTTRGVATGKTAVMWKSHSRLRNGAELIVGVRAPQLAAAPHVACIPTPPPPGD